MRDHAEIPFFPVDQTIRNQINLHPGFQSSRIFFDIISDHDALRRIQIQVPADLTVIIRIRFARARSFVRRDRLEIFRIESRPADPAVCRNLRKQRVCRKNRLTASFLQISEHPVKDGELKN